MAFLSRAGRQGYEAVEMQTLHRTAAAADLPDEPQHSSQVDTLVAADAERPSVTLADLPPEILLQIGSYLNPVQTHAFGQVCSQLRETAEAGWFRDVPRDIPAPMAHTSWLARFKTFPRDFQRAYLEAARRDQAVPDIFSTRFSLPIVHPLSEPASMGIFLGMCALLGGALGTLACMFGLGGRYLVSGPCTVRPDLQPERRLCDAADDVLMWGLAGCALGVSVLGPAMAVAGIWWNNAKRKAALRNALAVEV